MTRISSRYTFLKKKVFPFLWFGIIGIVGVGFLTQGAYERNPMFLFAPILMIVVGFFFMRKLVWDLADEVQDGGDFLLVRNRGMEERVPFTNIMNVNASTMTNPPRITLRLVTPGKFGREITFSPPKPLSLNPFAKNPVAEDLIVRVDRARSQRGALRST